MGGGRCSTWTTTGWYFWRSVRARRTTGRRTHLGTCANCRTELATLERVAGLGAETQGLNALPDPPEHLWQGIEAQVRAAEAGPSPTETRRVPAQASTVPAEQAPGAATGPTVTRLDPARRSRRGRGWSRWAATAVTAAAAAAVGVLGTVSVLRPDDRTPTPTPAVVASAPLAAYGATPPAATGDARVLQDGQLHLHVANLPSVPGYYEVWLIDPTTMEMFSVGTLGAARTPCCLCPRMSTSSATRLSTSPPSGTTTTPATPATAC